MAYDLELAERIRYFLSVDPSITEKKMFGGLCFLHNGNIVLGIIKDEMVTVCQ